MEPFYLICFIPIAIAVGAKIFLHHSINWLEFTLQILAGLLVVLAVYSAGAYSATWDTEVWNGQVTEKRRDHGHYERSYSCNCRTTKIGNTTSTTCDTCYEDRYTVDWYFNSTIGRISIDHKDSGSRRVYSSSDPTLYANASVGDHCAKDVSYTNYIKAAPDSIFHNVGLINTDLAKKVPEYNFVYDLYKRNVVHTISIPRDQNIRTMEETLQEGIKTLGPKKQVNVNVVVTDTPNENFRYALEREWLGGKKNDVTVVFGAPKYPEVAWVQVFTFGNSNGNNLLVSKLRNDLLFAKDVYTLEQAPDIFARIILNDVDEYFERKSMKEFEYLKDEIEPPTWVIILCILLSFLFGIGLTYIFHKKEISITSNYRNNTFKWKEF